jgi:HD superfamily phosphohydrolase
MTNYLYEKIYMKKVVRLTESDLEIIIKRIIEEQVQKQSKSFNVGNSFPSAQYKIQNTEFIDNAISQIRNMVSQYPDNTNFTITVNAGESRVPNPEGFEEEGSLAKARANEVLNYVKSKVTDLSNVDIVEPSFTIGKTPWDPRKGKDAEEYTKEQFVNLILNVAGERTLPPVRKPWYGIDNSGLNVFIGFMDGSIYKLSKNDPDQMKLYSMIGQSEPFDKWRQSRRDIDITCRKFPQRCQNIKYNFGTAKEIVDQNVVNEIIAKMKSEKLYTPIPMTN